MKTSHWGAAPEDWPKLIELGLSADLLPVVSNPGAPISSNSSIKGLGKLPSIYTSNGEVCGLSKWTEKSASLAEIAKWRKQRDYGVCIQTRRLRALDIDVSDREKSLRILNFIEEQLNQVFPYRHRNNSGKFLIPVWVEGTYGKRVLYVDGGMIEFLANGQQFVFSGTHPSGQRYQLNWSDHSDFIRITPERFETLWEAIELEFGIEKSVISKKPTRKRGEHNQAMVAMDATLKFLEENNHVIGYGPGGQAHITCPFSSEHTTGDNRSATSYFPKGTGGYDRGHFICFHGHCSGRSQEEFEQAFGVRLSEFDDLASSNRLSTCSNGTNGRTAGGFVSEEYEIEFPALTRAQGTGQPLATLSNIRRVISRFDITGCEIRSDNFLGKIVIRWSGEGWRALKDADYVRLRLLLTEKYQFKEISAQNMSQIVLEVADFYRMDSAVQWINDLPEWDGIPRVDNFVHVYLGGEDTPYTRAISRYIWTGLVARILKPGCKADMVPILRGPQGFYKSSAIKAIAPSLSQFAELDLAEKDDDLSRRMRGVIVVELPELKGLRTKELESIKATITRQIEKWIPKYHENEMEFPRRCLFFGSTNEDAFLDDSTGHRRFLPFDVLRPCSPETIKQDRNQLWAEARVIYMLDGLCFEDAERLAVAEHEKYAVHDCWIDIIRDWLHRDQENAEGKIDKPINWPYLRADIVAREALNIALHQFRKPEQMRLAEVLKALGYERKVERLDGRVQRVWRIKMFPPLPLSA